MSGQPEPSFVSKHILTKDNLVHLLVGGAGVWLAWLLLPHVPIILWVLINGCIWFLWEYRQADHDLERLTVHKILEGSAGFLGGAVSALSIWGWA